MKTALTVVVAALCPFAAWAADEIKPFDAKLGLWETAATTEISGVQMPSMPQIPKETLDKMPPQQRAQIEAMMKNAGNLGSPRTTTTKSCTTKASLAKAMSFGNEQKSCTRKVLTSTSSKQVIHIECNEQQMKSSGDLTLERIDAEHVKGDMLLKASDSQHPINIKMTLNAKWLSSDCGDVKPIE